MRKEVTFDHLISENGDISVRRITRVYDDDDTLLGEKYHRHVVRPSEAGSGNGEDNRTKKLIRVLMEDDEELAEIEAGLADADVVDPDETEEGEAAKKLTFLERLRAWMWS